MNKITIFSSIAGVALIAATSVMMINAKPEFTKQEESAYESVVTFYMGQDLNKVKTYDKAEVIGDLREYCDNLTKHEYRSDAVGATKLVDNELSYQLALTYGVEIMCNDAWKKAKKMN